MARWPSAALKRRTSYLCKQTNVCALKRLCARSGSFSITALNHDVTVQVASQEQPVCSQTMSKYAQQGLACLAACAGTEMD